MKSLLKKGLAECLGTFVLVLVACGVAAFTGGAAELVATSAAFGLVIVAMAYSIGRISGCHINPAVSLAMFVAKKINAKELGVYVLFQVIGGILGGLALFGLAKMGDFQLAGDASNYAYHGDAEFSKIMTAILVEVALTFIFVYVIFNATDEKANLGNFAGLVIGGTLTLVHLLGINFTGTSVNPARSLGTALGSLVYFDGETAPLEQVWIFLLAPLAGGVLAALVYKYLHSEKAE